MEGQWTFTQLNEVAWEHTTFDTREEAIEGAKKVCETGCVVGKLKRYGNGYKIVNLKEVIFN